MLEVSNLVTPSPEHFQVVIHGMRNAFKSWEKSDSHVVSKTNPWFDNGNNTYYIDGKKTRGKDVYDIVVEDNRYTIIDGSASQEFYIGNKDRKLFLDLCKAGDPSHRKVLRQLPVVCDITAPLYFFKQFDTYKIGTTANSTSTMHQLTKDPFKLENFSIDNYRSLFGSPQSEKELKAFEDLIVSDLNDLRDKYLETKDMKYWYALNEILPQSYNQTRTWSGNYEVLLNIINQRAGHKLSEWQTFIDYMIYHVPLLSDIYKAINETK